LNITKAAATKVTQTTWTILAAASICMLGSVAQAYDSSDYAAHKTVDYSDLNLGSSQGAAVLYSRLMSAAEVVCGSADHRDLAGLAAVKPCVDQAMTQAVTSINSPMLTSLYVAKTGTMDKQFATIALNR
jgi:UrcA family protein